MPDRSNKATARAEARRRARLRAQGQDVEDASEPDTPPSGGGSAPGGSFLTRIFPPTPPLPNLPDPLAGFTYSGPMRGIVGGLYLLARAPRAWVLGGAAWAIGELLARVAPPSDIVAVLASVGSFGALIAAGWFGWQRPWAFGLAAAVLGVGIFSGILGTAIINAGVDTELGVTGAALFLALLSQETFQLFIGALAGWYGGYLRRRMAASAPQQRRRR
jgi:hypothetical protein